MMVKILHHSEFGELRILMEDGLVYLAAKDLALITLISIPECLMKHFGRMSDVIITRETIIYYKATAVIQALSKYDNPRFHKVCQWIECDILPQYQLTPYRRIEMITLAKQVVLEQLNSTRPKDISEYTLDDVYIVWFCKTIRNWKALVSTDVVNGVYYEVTHNGERHETYVDVYERKNHLVIFGGEIND